MEPRRTNRLEEREQAFADDLSPTPAAASAELEQVLALRQATQRFLDAVDAWEQQHGEYYRLAQRPRVSSDLAPAEAEYQAARTELQQQIPVARRLCFRHGLRNPWLGILKVNLGTRSPQVGTTSSAIGHGERKLIATCLDTLEERLDRGSQSRMTLLDEEREREVHQPMEDRAEPAASRGILSRILGFFT